MREDVFSVEDQSTIVTGASRGIGRAIAERFAAGGANVVVSSRDIDHVGPVAEHINEEDGYSGDALARECDVRDRDSVREMVDATAEEFGSVDVLINNAGASFMAPFEEISANGWDTIVDINLNGTYHCSQEAGEHMRENGGGVIINVSSVAGQDGSPLMSHYGAAKAGIINLTTSLAAEWAEHDVRVNCIAPGFVATPGVAEQMGVEADEVNVDEVDRQVGKSDEIAAIAQFLASPASSYMVGETVTAKGVPGGLESPV